MALHILRTVRQQVPKLISANLQIIQPRPISLCAVRNGLEEFFPPGALESNEPIAESVKTGRRWKASELRVKSYSDLHKLWYVLLKERNMLLTVQWEARRQGVPMPSPTRLHKVKKSMAMIKVVIHERERAIQAVEGMEWDFDKEYETDLYVKNQLAALEESENADDTLEEETEMVVDENQGLDDLTKVKTATAT